MTSLPNQPEPVDSDELEPYFEGKMLWGDDFGQERLAEWFEDEREGYARLIASGGRELPYQSHVKNTRYGYRLLPDVKFGNVLGFGSADGREFVPILSRVDRITIVEPTERSSHPSIGNVPLTFVKPGIDGSLPLPDDSFDLATCFGALHHVASCTRVMKELFRCLRPNGHLLIEEPTVSMGDWRRPRPGLTKRERGIPLQLFRDIIANARFEIVNERRILFSGTGKLGRLLGVPFQTSEVTLRIDEVLCSVFAWNAKYHPRTLLEWLMPTNIFYVLRKPDA